MLPSDALQIVTYSDVGQVRARNEDSIASCPEIGLVVLADGMGGYKGGDVASGIATAVVAEGVKAAWTSDKLKNLTNADAKAFSQAVLQEQAKKANATIIAKAAADADCEGMCATLVACLFYDNFLTVAHLGDSRVYRLRGDALEQVTRDHSLVQEQIDAGLIRKEEAHLSNNRNVVTRALGADPDEQAEVHSYDVEPGDIYLACTDGLHGMIGDDEIQMAVSMLKANLDLTAQQLAQAANDAGGNDNVSIILVNIQNDFAATGNS